MPGMLDTWSQWIANRSAQSQGMPLPYPDAELKPIPPDEGSNLEKASKAVGGLSKYVQPPAFLARKPAVAEPPAPPPTDEPGTAPAVPGPKIPTEEESPSTPGVVPPVTPDQDKPAPADLAGWKMPEPTIQADPSGNQVLKPPPKLRVLNALGEEITNKPQSQVQQRDEYGRPIGAPPGSDDNSLLPMAEFQRRANAAVPQVQYQQGMSREMWNHLQLERAKHVDSLVHQQVTAHQRLRQHASDIASQATEHAEQRKARVELATMGQEENRRKEEARINLEVQKEELKATREHETLRRGQDADAYLKIHGEVTKNMEIPPEKKQAAIDEAFGAYMKKFGGKKSGQAAGGQGGGQPNPKDEQKGFEAAADAVLKKAGIAADAGMSHIKHQQVRDLAKRGTEVWNSIPRVMRSSELHGDMGRMVDHLLEVHNNGTDMSLKAYEKYKKLFAKLPDTQKPLFALPEK